MTDDGCCAMTVALLTTASRAKNDHDDILGLFKKKNPQGVGWRGRQGGEGGDINSCG